MGAWGDQLAVSQTGHIVYTSRQGVGAGRGGQQLGHPPINLEGADRADAPTMDHNRPRSDAPHDTPGAGATLATIIFASAIACTCKGGEGKASNDITRCTYECHHTVKRRWYKI